MEMDGPLPQEASAQCWNFTDDFSKQENPLEYNYLRNPHMEHYERDTQNACLVLTGTDVTLSDMDAPTIQMVRQREFCATAEVTVSPANVQKDGRLGLAALGAEAPYVYLGCGDTAGLCTEITRTMTFTGVYFGMFAERATGAFREFKVTYEE